MRLQIENFAKISSAEIRFDGLTVIAGDNNTGKSTVGKVLYSIFRGTSDIARRVKVERIKAVREVLVKATREPISDAECELVMSDVSTIRNVLAQKFTSEFGRDQIAPTSESMDRLISDFVSSFEPKIRASVENTL